MKSMDHNYFSPTSYDILEILDTRGQRSMITWVKEVSGFNSEALQHHSVIFHGPCRRRSIGPLPSCLLLTRPLHQRVRVVLGVLGVSYHSLGSLLVVHDISSMLLWEPRE